MFGMRERRRHSRLFLNFLWSWKREWNERFVVEMCLAFVRHQLSLIKLLIWKNYRWSLEVFIAMKFRWWHHFFQTVLVENKAVGETFPMTEETLSSLKITFKWSWISKIFPMDFNETSDVKCIHELKVIFEFLLSFMTEIYFMSTSLIDF